MSNPTKSTILSNFCSGTCSGTAEQKSQSVLWRNIGRYVFIIIDNDLSLLQYIAIASTNFLNASSNTASSNVKNLNMHICYVNSECTCYSFQTASFHNACLAMTEPTSSIALSNFHFCEFSQIWHVSQNGSAVDQSVVHIEFSYLKFLKNVIFHLYSNLAANNTFVTA